MASLGHPVVGDALYGAPRELKAESKPKKRSTQQALGLNRNFLHAAHLELAHPQTGKQISFDSPLPIVLQDFLAALESTAPTVSTI
jgi:23S rRNA pseudouridine1911/1915/1917 synthase